MKKSGLSQLCILMFIVVSAVFPVSAQFSLLKDINPGAESSMPTFNNTWVEHDGKLYFPALNSSSGLELWSTNGIESGTNVVFDLNPGN